MIHDFLKLLAAENLQVPAMELTLLLIGLTLTLVLRYTRIGLTIAYLFAYRWGWMLFAGRSQKFLFAYLFFGSFVCILTVIGFLKSSNEV